MVIEFGNWQLRPIDSNNWQLWHLRESTRGSNVGKVDWHPEGRFYSYSTIDNALLYAADREIKAMDGTVNFMEYVTLLRETLDDFEKSILTSLEPRHSPANDSPR